MLKRLPVYRHMRIKHRQEREVMEIEDLKRDRNNAKKWQSLAGILMNKGEFVHNLGVLRQQMGFLKVIREAIQ